MRLRPESSSDVDTFFSVKRPYAALQIVFLILMAVSSSAQELSVAPSFSISGVVKSGNSVIPGATVVASNPATGEKAVTSTDVNGSYSLQVARQGKYELHVEMPAFAPGTREIVLNGQNTRIDLELTLLSRTQQAARTQQPATAQGNRRFQSLAVMQGIAGAEGGNASPGDQIVPSGMPVPGIAADAATESVSISGNGSGVGMFGMSTDELDQRMRENREQQGGFGGSQGGPNVIYAGGGPGGTPSGGGPSGGGPGGLSRPAGGSAGGGSCPPPAVWISGPAGGAGVSAEEVVGQAM